MFLALSAAVSCGRGRPGISRSEAVRELAAIQAARDSVRKSIAASLDTFPADYVPAAGVRYEPVIRTGNVRVLDVGSALEDFRELPPDMLGTLSFMPAGRDFSLSPDLQPVDGGKSWIMSGEQGIFLLDSRMKYVKTLFENDVEIETTEMDGKRFITIRVKRCLFSPCAGDGCIRAYYLDNLTEERSSAWDMVTLPLDAMVSSDRPWTPDDIMSRLPIALDIYAAGSYADFGEGFLMVEPFSSRLATFGYRGDTLCRFAVNDAPDYVPQRDYRRGEEHSIYMAGGKVRFRLAYDNTIYELEDASTLNALYRLDFGSLKRPDGQYVVESVDNSLDGYWLVDNVAESDTHLIIGLHEGYDSPKAVEEGRVAFYCLVYDKRTGDFFSCAPEMPFRAGGDTLSLTPCTVADGRFYTVMPAATLRKKLPDLASLEGADDKESVIIMIDKH